MAVRHAVQEIHALCRIHGVLAASRSGHGEWSPQATYPFSPPLGPLDDPKKLVCCYVISWARNRADRLHVGMDLCFILEANKCLGKLVAMMA